MESWYPYEGIFVGHRSIWFYCSLFFYWLFFSFVFTLALEGVPGFVYCCTSGQLYCLHYFLDSNGQFTARAISLTLSYEEAPGPSATEGRCFIRGDWRSTWFAERQVCSVHSVPLFNNISPFFRPLIIDPAGRTVPAGSIWGCYAGWTVVFWLVRRLLRRWIQLLVRVFLATKAR